jgi:hypothetical protein
MDSPCGEHMTENGIQAKKLSKSQPGIACTPKQAKCSSNSQALHASWIQKIGNWQLTLRAADYT